MKDAEGRDDDSMGTRIQFTIGLPSEYQLQEQVQVQPSVSYECVTSANATYNSRSSKDDPSLCPLLQRGSTFEDAESRPTTHLVVLG
jgi:hypothetical protein